MCPIDILIIVSKQYVYKHILIVKNKTTYIHKIKKCVKETKTHGHSQ